MLYKGDTLYLNWLEDGIAELVFDAPGSVNKLDTATVASLGQALDVLEKQPELKGLLLRSNKAAFIVGADITEFLSLFLVPEEQLSQWLHFANSVFNRLEDLPVPTISAVNGYALGGGCECVLATDYRLATPDLRIGLPETKLGIMPGFGGSVRMPRMLGADSALEIIAAGKDVGAEQAQKIFALGVEKIAISHGALKNPTIVTELAEKVGSQSVVIVLDVKKKLFGGYEVYTHNGTKGTGKNPFDLIEEFQKLGAGEIVINNIDNDGVMKGYDLALMEKARKATTLPLTASGGAGSMDDIGELIKKFGIIGAAAGSLFVFKGKLKAVLINYPALKEKDQLNKKFFPKQ